jgi:hypothetical protein
MIVNDHNKLERMPFLQKEKLQTKELQMIKVRCIKTSLSLKKHTHTNMSCKGLDQNTKECCCHKYKKMHTQNHKRLEQDIKECCCSKRNIAIKEKMHTHTQVAND